VDFVLAGSVDAVEGREDLPGEADALGAPVGEEEENGRGAIVRVDVWRFIGGEQGGRERDGGEMDAEKRVLAAGFGDGYGFVGCESGRKRRIEFGSGFCSGSRVSGELLERGIGESIGVEGVDGNGSVGASCRR
jgi:hypothetical protein